MAGLAGLARRGNYVDRVIYSRFTTRSGGAVGIPHERKGREPKKLNTPFAGRCYETIEAGMHKVNTASSKPAALRPLTPRHALLTISRAQ